jgi:hypothetical protein
VLAAADHFLLAALLSHPAADDTAAPSPPMALYHRCKSSCVQWCRTPAAAGAGVAYCRGLAGHSKFQNIQHRKGRQDKKRNVLFTKLCGELWAAAREGGTDPATNYRLALAIERARENDVPKTNVQRAIAKAESSDAQDAMYELHGPQGVGLMVQVSTDSTNRARLAD